MTVSLTIHRLISYYTRVMEKERDNDIINIIRDVSVEESIEVFFVGGYVRDMILGQRSNDIDFVVEGDAIKFAKKVANKLKRKNIVTFPRFKTAKLNYRNYDLEFVSTRKENYNDENSRNPEVLTGSLAEDLSRRDFTINTLAININSSGKIIDLHEGINDIEKKVIRTPLDPNVTYSDDPLRMLRAIRFASKLNFKIDKNSFEAIKENSKRIEIVSEERITNEFFKILKSDFPVKGIFLLEKSGLLEIIFPELTRLIGQEFRDGVGHKDNFIHTLKVLNNVSKQTENYKLRLAALMHDIGKPHAKYFKKGSGWTFHGHDEEGSKIFIKLAQRLKFSNELTGYVSKIIALHHRPISLTKGEVTDSGVRRFLFEGRELVDDLMLLCRADITTSNKKKLNKYLDNFDKLSEKLVVVEEKDKLRNFKPPISGLDIMKEFQTGEGPLIGKVKKEIVDAIINGSIKNDRESAIEMLKSIKSAM